MQHILVTKVFTRNKTIKYVKNHEPHIKILLENIKKSSMQNRRLVTKILNIILI